MQFLTNLTLGKKITFLTSLGLLMGVVVFGSLGMRAVNQSTEAMLQDRLTTARLVADYLDESLGRGLAELESAAQQVALVATKDNIGQLLDRLEITYSRLSIHTEGVYLLDGMGQVVWSKPDVSGDTSIDITAYPDIGRTITTGEPGISGLVSAPGTGVPVILLISPTGGGQPGARETLVVAIDLSRSGMGGFVQPIRLGETGYVEVIDQSGTVVARTEPGPVLSPFEKSDHSGRFAALISDGKPARGVCHTCHEPDQKVERKDVLAFVPLSGVKWGVVVRQSEEEAMAPTRDLRQSLLLFGIGLVTIALAFVTVTTRDIGRRIRMLTVVSQRMAEGDLLSPVPAAGKDEVGILAQSFDEMRGKLRDSYGELEQKTKELFSLLSVSEIMTSALDISDILEAVVAKAVEVIAGADGGALVLQNPDQKEPVLQCAVGLNKEAINRSVFAKSATGSADVATSPEDMRQEDKVAQAVTALLESDDLRRRVQSHICGEVFHRGKHIGSLVIFSFRHTQAFSESDHNLLQTIADNIAIAIEKAQLAKEAGEVKALHEIDRLRSEFISSVSHELRTPLTLIKGYSTSMLRRDVSWDEETRREFLQIIDGKTDELRDLIDKLLQSAKLEAGALKLQKEPVLIPRLARKIVEELSNDPKKHKFTLSFAPSFPVVEADLRCIEQALRNLTENAIKYSPEGSEIIIAGKVEDGKVIVSVTDEGVGIPVEHQDKIFNRFYRVESPSTRGTPGSGLGLFITKGHIEAHGGKVWLESKAGKGSKFYFSLPLDHGGSADKT